jgi:hypothetical protein
MDDAGVSEVSKAADSRGTGSDSLDWTPCKLDSAVPRATSISEGVVNTSETSGGQSDTSIAKPD